MKSVFVFGVLLLSLSGRVVFASTDCSGTSVPDLAKFAQLELNIYSVSIEALTNYSQLDVSKVDPTERDLAICNTIGEGVHSLMSAMRGMRELQVKIQQRCAPGDPAQLDNYFWAIVEVALDLKHYCFKGYEDGYRDLDTLKLRLDASKKAMKVYSDLLTEYQK